MTKPKTLIVTGYGINCEAETALAFQLAGAESNVVHINDLIDGTVLMSDFQILVFPGGFSYGDDTGSGNALANRIKNNLPDVLHGFMKRDTLTLGICNGCQVLCHLGVVPGLDEHQFEREVSFTHNDSARYEDRWVHVAVPKTNCVFTQGLSHLYIPVAHGEGKFVTKDTVLRRLKERQQIALRYVKPDNAPARQEFPFNPNGSLDDVAGLTDVTGHVLALMPHPERHIFFTQHPEWTLMKEKLLRQNRPLPEKAEGLKIFENAVKYFL